MDSRCHSGSLPPGIAWQYQGVGRLLEKISHAGRDSYAAGERSSQRKVLVFALDTHTLIYFFKGIGKVKQRLLNTAPADILIPSIVLYELEVGILQSTHPQKRRAQLDSLTATVNVLNFGRHTARRAAEI